MTTGPVPYRSLGGYYGYGFTRVTTPGYARQDTTVLVKTLLHTVSGGDPTWSVASETFNPASMRETVEGVLTVVLHQLSAQGLIGRAPRR